MHIQVGEEDNWTPAQPLSKPCGKAQENQYWHHRLPRCASRLCSESAVVHNPNGYSQKIVYLR